jgi:hypothetical protein
MNKDEKNHYAKLAQLGCIVCKNEGWGYSEPEIHHMRSGQGRKKAHWSLAYPLCPNHHRNGGYGIAFHAGPRAFQDKFGTEAELLHQTLTILEAKIC